MLHRKQDQTNDIVSLGSEVVTLSHDDKSNSSSYIQVQITYNFLLDIIKRKVEIPKIPTSQKRFSLPYITYSSICSKNYYWR